jgi:murein DD-endopeptidase MepM/ murein hydrolase activator NlpD
MAGITFKGRVGSTGRSTGPHLHVEVQDLATGAFLNPETIRTPLSGLRIGEKRIPALIQTPEGKFTFNPEAGITITSKYGPRGGRQHKGEDWALPEGTPIFYEGAGKYVPLANQGAYGNLSTFTTGDNKYQIRLGHMQSLGEAADLSQGASTANTSVSNPSDFQGMLSGYLLGSLLRGEPKEDPKTQMMRGFVKELVQPQQNDMTGALFQQLLSSSTGGLFG